MHDLHGLADQGRGAGNADQKTRCNLQAAWHGTGTADGWHLETLMNDEVIS
jgi:hypothetical protein